MTRPPGCFPVDALNQVLKQTTQLRDSDRSVYYRQGSETATANCRPTLPGIAQGRLSRLALSPSRGMVESHVHQTAAGNNFHHFHPWTCPAQEWASCAARLPVAACNMVSISSFLSHVLRSVNQVLKQHGILY